MFIYKNLRLAFLYQVIVGLFSLSFVLYLGPYGIAILAIIGLRPFLLERENVDGELWPWRFSYQILKITIIITAVTQIVLFVIFQLWDLSYIFPGLQDSVSHLYIIPYFISIQGLVGTIIVENTDAL